MTEPWAAALLDRPAARAVLGLIGGAGHRAWLVGGAVRDAAMGRAPGDLDVATDAPPVAVLALAGSAGLAAVPTGLAHGTVTLLAPPDAPEPVEVTTLRADVETDGRHAVVAFGASLRADAARRDFTMNALYLAPDGTLSDPFGGLADARAGRVRFVGDPRARLAEDHLRALRYFRFQATHGDPAAGLDPDALDAVARSLDGIGRLSRERIGAEMRKLLAAPDPLPALAGMAATGLLARVLPGADPAGLGPTEMHAAALDLGPDWLRRLAALGGPDPTDALRLSRAEASRLRAIRDGAGLTPFAMGHRLGRDDGLAALALAGGTAAASVEAGATATFPLRAADLAPLSGAALGRRLRALESRWLAADGRLSRADLLTAGTNGDDNRSDPA